MAQPPATPKPRKPNRPANLPHGRWLGDLGPLSEAEQKLVECCAEGQICLLNNDKRPEEAKPEYTIRAELVRFLALGGDSVHPIHERGIMLAGAWIANALDIDSGTVVVDLVLRRCHFARTIVAHGAQLASLFLDGSAMPGLRADRMRASGSVLLRQGFTTIGEFRLHGATIGGDLDCSNGSFSNDGGTAISVEGISVERMLCLRGTSVMGGIWMTAARLGTLADDADTWSAGGNILDGLQYDRIVGPVDAASRLAWLYSQQPDQLDYRDFAPQPWEHVIRVLRDMGHPHAAAEIAMAKQVQMRKAGKIGKWGTWRELGGWSKAKSLVQNGLHWMYGALAGYGYRPLRTVGFMVMLWIACSSAFYAGRDGGYFGPTSAAIEINPKFAECGAPGDLIAPRTRDPKLKVQPKPMPKAHWTAAACPLPPEYTSFQPAMYSLDLILPVVNLQQDGDWAPIVSNARGEPLPWGQLLRALVWFEILFGWVATLVVAAVLGNLVKKD